MSKTTPVSEPISNAEQERMLRDISAGLDTITSRLNDMSDRLSEIEQRGDAADAETIGALRQRVDEFEALGKSNSDRLAEFEARDAERAANVVGPSLVGDASGDFVKYIMTTYFREDLVRFERERDTIVYPVASDE